MNQQGSLYTTSRTGILSSKTGHCGLGNRANTWCWHYVFSSNMYTCSA